jgi:acyl-homoserine-lactone acylase
VPHIRSASWAGLGFGQGWSIAGDHLPTIADQIVKVRSERARYHGAGEGEHHLASDLGYRALGVVEHARALRDAQPPWIRELVTGYVGGYNQRLGEVVAEGTLPAWCAGAEWIRPIDELDLYAYLGDIALMGSGRNLAHLIGWAQAPGPDGPYPAASLAALGGAELASNGWAIGGDVTASGGGIVLANPHFPWGGEARFWECHLTLPGQLDCYGVSLLGAPGIQMGFNQDVAWAHTFSKGHRFALYQLRLAAGAPTSYHYGDEVREMTSIDQTVQVLGEDGGLAPVTRTMWRTHHGPMLNMPLLGWGNEVAFSYRDANGDNTAVLEQFLGMAMADDLADFRRVFHEVKALP